MTKGKHKKVKNNKVEKQQSFESIKNEVDQLKDKLVSNGLTEALLGTNSNLTSQLSEADTLFRNSRWYFISNMRQLLSEIYVEHGLVQTIVDVPVDDAMRGGVKIKTKQLDEDQIHKLETFMKRKDDFGTQSQAMKWNRLFGGAAIIIITEQDPEEPLDINKLENGKMEFRAVDMWELFHDQQAAEGHHMGLKTDNLDLEYYTYYGQKIHKTKIIKMKGLVAPSFVRPRLRGWGFSVIEVMVRSINQYLKATDLTFEILDEFKLDIFKIKGLTNTLLQSGGTAKIQQRVQLNNQQKNYQNALTMDSEDDYVQKQLSFAGISETMTGIRMQIASDLRMPITKLFGVSASGFNAGEGDLENYNAMVEGQVRQKSHFDTLTLIELRCAQIFGFVPDDLDIEREPLRVLSANQAEEVKDRKFARALQSKQAGEMTSKEFREACNSDDLLPNKLDTDDKELNPETKDEPMQGAGAAPAVPKATNSLGEELDSYTPHGLANFKGRKVAVVAVTSGDEILTGLRRDTGLWTCPGGHVDGDEDIRDAAVRELFEESGLVVSSTSLIPLCEKLLEDKNGEKIAVFVFKAALPKKIATSENDPDNEVSEWKWVLIDNDTPELQYANRHAGANDLVIRKLRYL